jgi:serine/threonine protein kinase
MGTQSTVLVSGDGRALIADFQDPGSSTVRYSAPEVLKKRKPTIAADMWSFGCVLYEVHLKSSYKNTD